MFTFSVFHQQAFDIVLGFLLIFGMTGYFQYRAIRDLRPEIAIARRTRKLRGYLFGLVGILAFAATVQVLFIVSLLDVYPQHWVGLLVCLTMGLIMIGFGVGNRAAFRISRKRKH